jgi:DNA-binding CsgD family transcriptional regulator
VILSKSDLQKIQEIIEQLQKVVVESEVETELLRLKEIIPFSTFALSLIEMNNKFDLIDYQQVCDFSEEWKNRYLQGQYWLHEDVIHLERFKALPTEVKRWQDIYKKLELTAKQKDFLGESIDFGLRDGYMYGYSSIRFREASLMTISGNPNELEFNDRSKFVIQHLTPHFHAAMVRVKIAKNRKVLTETQLQVLELTVLGLTAKDIALELGKSVRAVEDLSKRVKENLDAHRTPDAIAKSIELGLIRI